MTNKNITKHIVTYLIVIALAIMFYSDISQFICSKSIIKIDSRFEFGYWLIVTLVSIYFLYLLVTDYIVAKKLYLYYSLVALIYLIYRLCYGEDLYLKINNYINYEDIIIYIFILMTILVIKSKFSNLNSNWDTYIKDNDEFIDEEIHFKKLADCIVEDFQDYRGAISFSIGLNGVFGSGKTVLLKYLEKKFQTKPNVISCWFEPRQYQDKDSITKGFLNIVESALAEYSGDISNQIDSYITTLVKAGNNSIIDRISELSMGSVSPLSLKDDIKESILKINKTVVIFIDDLDRLDKNEIIEVLKLLRSISHFPNFVYILGIDYEKVKEITDKTDVDFDKYFNILYNLPKRDFFLLSDYLVNCLDFLPIEISEKRYLDKNQKLDAVSLFNSIREITHFSNKLKLSYTLITKDNNNVDVKVFYSFNLILDRFPFLRDFFIYIFDNALPLNHNYLKKGSEFKAPRNGLLKGYYQTSIEDFLQYNQIALSLYNENNNQIDKLVGILANINTDFSVNNPVYLKMYLSDNQLSNVSVSYMISLIEKWKLNPNDDIIDFLLKHFAYGDKVYKVNIEVIKIILNYRDISSNLSLEYISLLFKIFYEFNFSLYDDGNAYMFQILNKAISDFFKKDGGRENIVVLKKYFEHLELVIKKANQRDFGSLQLFHDTVYFGLTNYKNDTIDYIQSVDFGIIHYSLLSAYENDMEFLKPEEVKELESIFVDYDKYNAENIHIIFYHLLRYSNNFAFLSDNLKEKCKKLIQSNLDAILDIYNPNTEVLNWNNKKRVYGQQHIFELNIYINNQGLCETQIYDLAVAISNNESKPENLEMIYKNYSAFLNCLDTKDCKEENIKKIDYVKRIIKANNAVEPENIPRKLSIIEFNDLRSDFDKLTPNP